MIAKLFKKLDRIFDGTVSIFAALSGVVLVFAMLLINADVIMRYFIKKPIAWSVEISGYALVWLTFLGTAWVLRKDGHVKMDMVIKRLKPRGQAMLNSIISTVIAIACAIALWYSLKSVIELLQAHYYTPTALELPLGIVAIIIPAGFMMLIIQSIKNIQRNWKRWRNLKS